MEGHPTTCLLEKGAQKLDVFNVEQKEPDTLIPAHSKAGKNYLRRWKLGQGSRVGRPGRAQWGIWDVGNALFLDLRALVPHCIYYMKIHGAPHLTSKHFSRYIR